MANEIIYVCNSTNNKNVREGELNILRKNEEQLFFEFGENEINLKKRFYNDLETLNKDFNELLKLKESEEVAEREIIKEEIKEIEELREEEVEEFSTEEVKEEPVEEPKIKSKKKYGKKNSSLF